MDRKMASTVQQTGQTILITVPRRIAVPTSQSHNFGEVSRALKSTNSTTLLPQSIQIKKEGESQSQKMFYIKSSSRMNFEAINSSLETDSESNIEAGMPRKRKRLTHLTPDERLMRRKLKNRVAAQTARDRKKARMDELEVLVTKLESENADLMDENDELHSHTDRLQEENLRLRKLLAGQSLDEVKKEMESCESAELVSPLQRDVIPPRSPLLNRLVTLLTALSLMQSSTSSKTCVPNPYRRSHHRLSKEKYRQIQHKLTKLINKWWGPQQKSWNPSMNL